MPEWLDKAVLGAVLAVLGYVGKGIGEFVARVRAEGRARRARLTQLLALIRAGDTAFRVQSDARDQLRDSLLRRDERLKRLEGYEAIFSAAYPSLTPAERELFDIVRAITVYTIASLNDALIKWLEADVDFRGVSRGSQSQRRLAAYLSDLEAHLLLWRAKFAAWIPSHPDRALVYLADEKRHGVPFPQDGALIIQAVLKLGPLARAVGAGGPALARTRDRGSESSVGESTP